MTVWVGMAALVVDLSRIRIGEDELKRMAQAAAVAAMIGLRDTTSDSASAESSAQSKAQRMVDKNRSNGALGASLTLSFGYWDWADTNESNRFKTKDPTDFASAVKVIVRRDAASSAGKLELFLTPALDVVVQDSVLHSVTTEALAQAAFRPRRVAFLVDISRSYNDVISANVKPKLYDYLQWMYDRNVVGDEVAMIHFTGNATTWSALQDLSANYATLRTKYNTLNYCEKRVDDWYYYHRYWGYQFKDENWECWDRDRDGTADINVDTASLDHEDVNGDGSVNATDCRDMYNVEMWHDKYRNKRIRANSIKGTTPTRGTAPVVDIPPDDGDTNNDTYDCTTTNGGFNDECAHVASFLDYKAARGLFHYNAGDPFLQCRDGHQFADADDWDNNEEPRCIQSGELAPVPVTPNPTLFGCPFPAYWDAGKQTHDAISLGRSVLTGGAWSAPDRYAMDEMILVTDGAAQCWNVDAGSGPPAWSRNVKPPYQLTDGWDDADIENCDDYLENQANSQANTAWNTNEIHIHVVYYDNPLDPDTNDTDSPVAYARGQGMKLASSVASNIGVNLDKVETDIPIVLTR